MAEKSQALNLRDFQGAYLVGEYRGADPTPIEYLDKHGNRVKKIILKATIEFTAPGSARGVPVNASLPDDFDIKGFNRGNIVICGLTRLANEKGSLSAYLSSMSLL